MALTKKKKIIIGSIAIVVLERWWLLSVSLPAGKIRKPEVTTIKLLRRDLNWRQTVTAFGRGQTDPGYIKLTSEVQGRIEEIYVNAGDVVKVGTPLVRIDPDSTTVKSGCSSGRQLRLR